MHDILSVSYEAMCSKFEFQTLSLQYKLNRLITKFTKSDAVIK